jgi:hypothetical protein
MTHRYMITRTTNGGYLVEEYEPAEVNSFDRRTGVIFAYTSGADAINGLIYLIMAQDDADPVPVPTDDDRKPMFAEPGDAAVPPQRPPMSPDDYAFANLQPPAHCAPEEGDE